MEFKVLKDEGFLYESSMPTQKFMNPPLSIAQFRIVKFSALWDSLAYSNIAVLARRLLRCPVGRGTFSGSRFNSWAILAYWCTLLQAMLGRAIALRLC